MRKRTAFWVEGMSSKERDHCVSSLFTLLEQKQGTVCNKQGTVRNKQGTVRNKIDVPAKRTFVFVPDPPTLIFEEQIQGLDIHRVSWGVAGRAAATGTVQMAEALAPVMFDLWSDSLYVLAFEAEVPEDSILAQWITEVLRIEFDAAPPSDKMQVPLLPAYTLVVFDWGDLVNEESGK